MEKRNTLLLTVIAVATLLVAVVGATFAYFANQAQTTNVANLNATTAASSSAFITTGAEIVMNVTAANMVEALGLNTGNLAATSATTTDNFKVSFMAGTTEQLTCTYNVYYEWINGATQANQYAKTAELAENAKEFTYTITKDSASFAAETQFVDSSEEGTGEQAGQTVSHSRVLVGASSITNSSASQATVQEFVITTKFYNFDRSQNDNAGKNWLIKFYVDDVVC